jgi:dTMP kinase
VTAADSTTHSGLFVVLEGGEGAGKSTQAQLLADQVRQRGIECVTTREPGGTAVGAAIRALLLDPATGALDDRTEALLYAADRAEHVASVIRPALQRSAVVISDRFVDSSLAYQGAGRALEQEQVRELSAWATGGLLPDLTVVLDVDPEVGLQRFSGADRLEGESLEFHRRVRAAFLALADAEPERYLVIDAVQDQALIAATIAERLARMLGEVRQGA